MLRAETKKETKKGGFVAGFYSSLDVVYELSLVKRSNMQRPL